MPKLGAEPIRKAALINAAIATVGRKGSLDVTVAQIARAAGVSSALAHHYFGSKERIFLAAMRHILGLYGQATREALRGLADPGEPRARLFALVSASFGGTNFERETAAAWLNFYALALIDPEAARLLRIYHGRLRSNLVLCLRPLVGPDADRIALTLGALIDGLYLRAVLSADLDGPKAEGLVLDYLQKVLP